MTNMERMMTIGRNKCRRHQMLVASHADTPLGVSKWLVDDGCPAPRLPLGRRPINRHKTLHHIFRIEIDARFTKYIRQFILKRHTPMVLPLILDVSLNGRHERLAVGECSITTLPTERTMKEVLVNPFGRLYLQRLYKVGYRLTGMHADEDMYMVGCAVDGMNKMLAVFAGTNQVSVEFALPAVLDKSFASAYGKDKVHVDLCVGVSHCVLFVFIVSHAYGMLLIYVVRHFPAISKPLKGHQHGWLPSSDAYGILLICVCRPFPAISKHIKGHLHGWLPSSDAYGILLICVCRPYPAISKPLKGHLHGWLPTSDAYGILSWLQN